MMVAHVYRPHPKKQDLIKIARHIIGELGYHQYSDDILIPWLKTSTLTGYNPQQFQNIPAARLPSAGVTAMKIAAGSGRAVMDATTRSEILLLFSTIRPSAQQTSSILDTARSRIEEQLRQRQHDYDGEPEMPPGLIITADGMVEWTQSQPKKD